MRRPPPGYKNRSRESARRRRERFLSMDVLSDSFARLAESSQSMTNELTLFRQRIEALGLELELQQRCIIAGEFIDRTASEEPT